MRIAAMPTVVDLYWIPLGAGGSFVRLNGKVYEAAPGCWLDPTAPRCDLYHSALVVHAPDGRYTIECAWVSSTDSDRARSGGGRVCRRRRSPVVSVSCDTRSAAGSTG